MTVQPILGVHEEVVRKSGQSLYKKQSLNLLSYNIPHPLYSGLERKLIFIWVSSAFSHAMFFSFFLLDWFTVLKMKLSVWARNIKKIFRCTHGETSDLTKLYMSDIIPAEQCLNVIKARLIFLRIQHSICATRDTYWPSTFYKGFLKLLKRPFHIFSTNKHTRILFFHLF